MNTSNCDLREVFNWGSPPMRERSRGRETKRKRVRGGGGGRWNKDAACMIFQYCRSTLSPIFVADYISLLPYPNLRDHFTTAARSNLREEALDWNRSAPARLRHDRQREQRFLADAERDRRARSGELR